jgi:tetratricopeptide (TPR) repeat protein
MLESARRGSRDRFLTADILWRRAETLRLLGRFREALAAYWDSHRFYRLCRVRSERLRTMLGASACLRVLGRFGDARKIRFFFASDPSPSEVLLEKALVRRGLGDFSGARRLLKECLRRTKDDEVARHAWWALGGVERFSGGLRSSLQAFARAERLAKRLNDDSARAYALCGQAGTLRVLGRGAASHRKYREAFTLAKRVKDPFGQAYGLCGMANALRVYGDTGKTLALYDRAARLYERLGDRGSAAFCWWGRAGSLRRLGRLREALPLYRKALATFRRFGDHRGEVMALLGLARTHSQKGDRFQAERWATRALSGARAKSLAFESALARREFALLSGADRLSDLGQLGLPPAVVRSWRDLP